jgi:hypothetical protein
MKSRTLGERHNPQGFVCHFCDGSALSSYQTRSSFGGCFCFGLAQYGANGESDARNAAA